MTVGGSRGCEAVAALAIVVVAAALVAGGNAGPLSETPTYRAFVATGRLPLHAAERRDQQAPYGGMHSVIVDLALRGLLVEALKTAQDELEVRPDDTHLLNNLGCILLFALNEASWSRAEEFFRRSLQSNALNAAAMHNYAMLLSARTHSHRHNKQCAARQLLRAAFQLDPALPDTVLTARALLLESSCARRRDEASTDDSSTGTLNSCDSRDDTGGSILHGRGEQQEWGHEVTFGVKSKEHARSLLTLAHGAAPGGGGKRQRCSEGWSNGRTRDQHTTRSACKRKRIRPRTVLRQDEALGSATCITAINAGEAQSLVFCTSLSTSKVRKGSD
jgi:hypothetical protein